MTAASVDIEPSASGTAAFETLTRGLLQVERELDRAVQEAGASVYVGRPPTARSARTCRRGMPPGACAFSSADTAFSAARCRVGPKENKCSVACQYC